MNYIQRTYTYGFDLKEALDSKQNFDFDKVKPKLSTIGAAAASTPMTRTTGTTRRKKVGETTESVVEESEDNNAFRAVMDDVDKIILNAEVKQFVERKAKYKDNMNKAYTLILGHCTLGLKGKLELRKNWETKIKKQCNSVAGSNKRDNT